ncbi:MAG: PilZ domain-containing protein [Candidatus Omnitrophica bacterium]|nr:PilZ domain-containing protein [Candidatus Omnitrophota bacterium]
MIGDIFKEKRKYPRIELRLSAKYKLLDYEQAFQFTGTENISAEGLSFASSEPLKPGAYVQLEVDIEDANPPISIVAEIRWIGDIGIDRNKKYINGVKIISMPLKDESRFLKYYCNKIVEKLSGYLKQ